MLVVMLTVADAREVLSASLIVTPESTMTGVEVVLLASVKEVVPFEVVTIGLGLTVFTISSLFVVSVEILPATSVTVAVTE